MLVDGQGHDLAALVRQLRCGGNRRAVLRAAVTDKYERQQRGKRQVKRHRASRSVARKDRRRGHDRCVSWWPGVRVFERGIWCFRSLPMCARLFHCVILTSIHTILSSSTHGQISVSDFCAHDFDDFLRPTFLNLDFSDFQLNPVSL